MVILHVVGQIAWKKNHYDEWYEFNFFLLITDTCCFKLKYIKYITPES